MEEQKGFEHKLSGGIGADYWPDYKPASIDNWEIQEQRVQKDEEATAKVNRYSVEERREKILKYLKKRNQRNFNKTIKYACRKTLADRRVRVRGRFAKNSEISEDEALALKNNHTPSEVNHNWYYHNNDNNASFQMNLCEEEWLQEAIASLADNNVSEWATFENIQE
ncbi:hypothetical protein Leryth_014398 [Lithospermum erythrorhizon]|nr:hypothetical protein Leryth_014398 [Lithospermum erythrorhizon]